MGIPYGRRYSSTFALRAWIPVRCEHCGALFAYKIERTVRGEGSSILWLDNEGASERARDEAVRAAEFALKSALEPVPCITCGSYQAAMIHLLRQRESDSGYLLALTSCIVWLFWTGCSDELRTTDFISLGTHMPRIIALIALIGCLVGGLVAGHRLDPVAHARTHGFPPDKLIKLTQTDYDSLKKAGYALAR